MILGIDPGQVQSAWIFLEPKPGGVHVGRFGISPNEHVVNNLIMRRGTVDLVIEMIASYGMAVGEETFETVVWIGRFMQAYANPERTHRMKRLKVKTHLCHDSRAKDGNIRQALIDRFGGKDAAVGKRGAPGPLYGISKDVWAALALAITFAETNPQRAHSTANLQSIN